MIKILRTRYPQFQFVPFEADGLAIHIQDGELHLATYFEDGLLDPQFLMFLLDWWVINKTPELEAFLEYGCDIFNIYWGEHEYENDQI